MPVWDYKMISRQSHEMLSEEQLNTMGANGFELLQVLNVSESMTVVGRRETVNKVYYFFKRVRAAHPQGVKPAAAAPRPPVPPAAPSAAGAG